MKEFILPILLAVCFQAQAKQYDILDYGAQPGQHATREIQKTIDACAKDGGGMVVIPAGKFISGTLILKSHVNVYLEQGAVLLGSANIDDYQSTFRTHGVFFCEDAINVSITGPGTIDAGGSRFYDSTQNHVYEEFDKYQTRQKEQYMPEGKFYSDGPIKRLPKPGMTIAFYHCSQVRLSDFTLRDTPSWAVRLAYCEGVLVHGLSILNNLMIPNSDGVHCTASRNVRMSDCHISAGDDAFIVTGFSLDEDQVGFDHEKQLLRPYGNKSIYAENINVNNCQFQSRSSGIRIGYGQHPIRHCVFTNIQIYDSNRGIGIFAHDATDIEELIFSNITIETRLHNGQWWGNGEPIHISAISRFDGEPAGHVRNVQFNNIIATGEHGLLFYGTGESHLENIRMNNVHLTVKKGRETLTYGGNFDLRPAIPIAMQLFEHDIPGIYAQYVDGLSFTDCSINWGDGLPDFFTHALHCQHVRDLYLDHLTGTANPACPDCEAIKLEDSSLTEN